MTVASTYYGIIVKRASTNPFPENLIYNPALINSVDKQIDIRWAARTDGYGSIIEAGMKFLEKHPKMIIPTRGGIEIVFNTPGILIAGIQRNFSD